MRSMESLTAKTCHGQMLEAAVKIVNGELVGSTERFLFYFQTWH